MSKFIEAGPQARRRDLVDTLTSFLGEVGKAGEASEEFIKLYKKVYYCLISKLIKDYLIFKGMLIITE